jgi:hypothetical protein
MMATLLIATLSRKKKTLPTRNKTNPKFPLLCLTKPRSTFMRKLANQLKALVARIASKNHSYYSSRIKNIWRQIEGLETVARTHINI